MTPKTCHTCNATFRGRPNKKYCSTRCKDASTNATKAKVRAERRLTCTNEWCLEEGKSYVEVRTNGKALCAVCNRGGEIYFHGGNPYGGFFHVPFDLSPEIYNYGDISQLMDHLDGDMYFDGRHIVRVEHPSEGYGFTHAGTNVVPFPRSRRSRMFRKQLAEAA